MDTYTKKRGIFQSGYKVPPPKRETSGSYPGASSCGIIDRVELKQFLLANGVLVASRGFTRCHQGVRLYFVPSYDTQQVVTSTRPAQSVVHLRLSLVVMTAHATRVAAQSATASIWRILHGCTGIRTRPLFPAHPTDLYL